MVMGWRFWRCSCYQSRRTEKEDECEVDAREPHVSTEVCKREKAQEEWTRGASRSLNRRETICEL